MTLGRETCVRGRPASEGDLRHADFVNYFFIRVKGRPASSNRRRRATEIGQRETCVKWKGDLRRVVALLRLLLLWVAWYAQNAVHGAPHARTASVDTPDPPPTARSAEITPASRTIARVSAEQVSAGTSQRRNNKPKRTRSRTVCRYCNDKRVGVHWKLRNKKPCARLDTCIAKKYAPRKTGQPAACSKRPAACPAPCCPLICARMVCNGIADDQHAAMQAVDYHATPTPPVVCIQSGDAPPHGATVSRSDTSNLPPPRSMSWAMMAPPYRPALDPSMSIVTSPRTVRFCPV